MDHNLTIHQYPDVPGYKNLRFTGVCSCVEWDFSADTRAGILMAHGDHVQEAKRNEFQWQVVEQKWMGTWTEPEPSEGPELISITGDLHPDIVQVETVMKDGRRRIWKKVT